MPEPVITVEYWRCLRDAEGLVLFLLVEGHEQDREYMIEAALHHKDSPVDVVLTTHNRLAESPAHVEVVIKTDGLPAGEYEVSVAFDNVDLGRFPCEVGEPTNA